ncbi:hypothetical protein O181_075613 [Austropuccinia psidii MF-1]|uniref:Uncharacterized protein n=1 Tax=Austropuccinia psidii MF-1 TaxID=1389203 RepID=A0A9Q3IC20_9BASI|nr:hypothetical protein [Austropuccinia psidii MF-1]
MVRPRLLLSNFLHPWLPAPQGHPYLDLTCKSQSTSHYSVIEFVVGVVEVRTSPNRRSSGCGASSRQGHGLIGVGLDGLAMILSTTALIGVLQYSRLDDGFSESSIRAPNIRQQESYQNSFKYTIAFTTYLSFRPAIPAAMSTPSDCATLSREKHTSDYANGKGSGPKSWQSLAARLRPRISTLLISFLAYRFAKPRPSNGLLKRISKWLALWFAVLNWRAVPMYWHIMTLFPILAAKMKRWRLGLSLEGFVERSGIIGTSPFDARIISKHCATWNTCDFLLHMSNSAYAMALDEVRAIWHVKMISIAMRGDHEVVRPVVASTHFTYFSEIPMLADFQVEFRPVSWDNKWLYLLATFTTDPPKGSKTRTLNCLSITRTVNKIGRRTVCPSKLLAICGFGKDPSHWKHINYLRRQPCNKKSKLRPSQEWLLNGTTDNFLSEFEPIRKQNLEIIRCALDGDSINGAERLKEL